MASRGEGESEAIPGGGESGAADPESSDTLLMIRKAQEGDRKALDDLFERFAPFVEKIVSVLLGSGGVEEADDYLQECLLKAYRRLETFPTDSGKKNFRGWLRAIARSVILDEKKKWKRIKRGGGREKRWSDYGSTCLSSSILPAAPGGTPSEVAMKREDGKLAADFAEKALRCLPEHQRKLILLRDSCELSFEEIAAHLKTANVAAVRKAYYKAREAFLKAPV